MSKKKTCATLPDYGDRLWACVPRRIGDTWSPTARASPHDVSNQLSDGGFVETTMSIASSLHAKKTAKPLPHVCHCQGPVKFHHSASAREPLAALRICFSAPRALQPCVHFSHSKNAIHQFQRNPKKMKNKKKNPE